MAGTRGQTRDPRERSPHHPISSPENNDRARSLARASGATKRRRRGEAASVRRAASRRHPGARSRGEAKQSEAEAEARRGEAPVEARARRRRSSTGLITPGAAFRHRSIGMALVTACGSPDGHAVRSGAPGEAPHTPGDALRDDRGRCTNGPCVGPGPADRTAPADDGLCRRWALPAMGSAGDGLCRRWALPAMGSAGDGLRRRRTPVTRGSGGTARSCRREARSEGPARSRPRCCAGSGRCRRRSCSSTG